MAISADQWAFALLSIHMTWNPETEPGGDDRRGWGLGQPEACNFSFVKLSLPVDADAAKQSSGHDLE